MALVLIRIKRRSGLKEGQDIASIASINMQLICLDRIYFCKIEVWWYFHAPITMF